MLLTLTSLVAQYVAAGEATPEKTPFDYITTIASTGIVGIILLMILFRFKIIPAYVHDDAKTEWARERAQIEANHQRERDGWEAERKIHEQDKVELKEAVAKSQEVYVSQVIPTLTRVLDYERELLELRRDQARRDQGGG